jgi:aryl-alcohol dehydrogenase-like predicted oxidoreductase
VGLGTMGFSHGYGPGVGDDEAVDLMRQAFDLGCTFFDTAESYAAGENERLVGRALAPIRDHVVIATKFRIVDSASGAEVGRQMPIPGSRKLDRIQENLGAADVDLTDREFGRIEAELAKIEIHGNRTDEDIAKLRDLH